MRSGPFCKEEALREIEFDGIKVQYDERCILSWKWQKAINSGIPARSVKAVEQLFAGRDEEYAEALSTSEDPELDDAAEKMSELIAAVTEDMGRKAKN